MPDLDYEALPFQEALEQLREKTLLPTSEWLDVIEEKNDVAFVIAGATKASFLADILRLLETAIEEGTTLPEFEKGYAQAVQDAGWEHRGPLPWRAALAYQTNLSVTHAAGRHRQMTRPSNLRRRPFWLYRHGGSADPRQHHLALDGLVLPADHEFWQTHSPPNGFGCSCSKFALSQRDVERRGLTVSDDPPDQGTYEWVDPKTGEVRVLPRTLDPGWGYAPGASSANDRQRLIDAAKRRLPPGLLEAFESDVE